jgi:hypothetical protein
MVAALLDHDIERAIAARSDPEFAAVFIALHTARPRLIGTE